MTYTYMKTQRPRSPGSYSGETGSFCVDSSCARSSLTGYMGTQVSQVCLGLEGARGLTEDSEGDTLTPAGGIAFISNEVGSREH